MRLSSKSLRKIKTTGLIDLGKQLGGGLRDGLLIFPGMRPAMEKTDLGLGSLKLQQHYCQPIESAEHAMSQKQNHDAWINSDIVVL